MRLNSNSRSIYQIGAVIICSLFVLFMIFTISTNASAQTMQTGIQENELHDLSDTGPIVGNKVCLGCHGTPGLSMVLDNGDVLDLYVDPDIYNASIHGQDGYACVQCHTNLGDYPHPTFTATDLRDVTLQLTNVCDRCHSGEYNLTMDSVHAAAQAEGMREAAVCVDCHGSHNISRWTDPTTHKILPSARLQIPITCSQCHFAIYQKYRSSVHGAALTEDENTDVPTCIDCHGVHNIPNPTLESFRLKSPELCASCHTNPAIMNKYGIATDVLSTYVSDFHGTTITLFEKQSPDAPVNQPVCYDCHGVHDISNVNNPQTGLDMKQNLLARCRVCHPDATSNFPTAWMSHYIPSPQNYSIVYYVNLFYKIFIPLVLGGMVVLVGMDVGHTLYFKSRKGKPHSGSSRPETPKPSTPTKPVPAEKSQGDSETHHEEDAHA